MVRYDLTYWFFSVAAGPPCITNREASSLLFTWQENLSYQSPGGDITPHCLGVKLLSTVGLLLCRARRNHMENREPHLCHPKQRSLFPRCIFCGGFHHHKLQPRSWLYQTMWNRCRDVVVEGHIIELGEPFASGKENGEGRGRGEVSIQAT
jgi:hypothetical protein